MFSISRAPHFLRHFSVCLNPAARFYSSYNKYDPIMIANHLRQRVHTASVSFAVSFHNDRLLRWSVSVGTRCNAMCQSMLRGRFRQFTTRYCHLAAHVGTG